MILLLRFHLIDALAIGGPCTLRLDAAVETVVELDYRLFAVYSPARCCSQHQWRIRSRTNLSSRVSHNLSWPKLTFHCGKFPHGVDEGVGDVGVSHLRSRRTANLNATYCATEQSVDAWVLL